MVNSKKKELWTDEDRKKGLAEKKGLDMGKEDLMTAKDKKNGLFTDEDRKGLL